MHGILCKIYLSPFKPNINFTKPLKNFGTFFTTICINSHPPLPHNQAIPSTTKTQPMQNNQPAIGSNNTSSIPVPIPIRQSPIVFFNASNNILPPL